MKWSGSSDLKKQVRRWWESGELLSSLTREETLFPRRLRLKLPTSKEIADNYSEIRDWIADVRQTPYCRIVMHEIKHNVFGRNEIPAQVWIDTVDDAVALLGKRRDLNLFMVLIDKTRKREPAVLKWLEKRPLAALELHDKWDRLLDVVAWLQVRPRPNIYLREMDIPGIDTKFVETHRAILAEWLDLALPPQSINASASGNKYFIHRYGFREKPLRVRFRILDPEHYILPVAGQQDITVDSDTFAQLNPNVLHVFFTENETNFLCFPDLPKSLVVFGAGYGFDMLARAEWLNRRRVYYWGDIDTHGFAILHAARQYLPHVRSIMMNEETLLAHAQFWGREESPHSARAFSRLTVEEQALYTDIKQHRWRENLRLEQERIAWTYACNAIFAAMQ